MVSNISEHLNFTVGSLKKKKKARFQTQIFSSALLRWRLKICMSNKFENDASTAGLGVTVWRTSHLKNKRSRMAKTSVV